MDTVVVHLLKTGEARGKEDILLALLPEDRIRKAKRFVREEDRLRSLCAGFLLTRWIGDYSVDGFGKPRSEKCCFSLSHSEDLVGLAVGGDREIGLDLERVRAGKDFDRLARFCLSGEELACLGRDADFLSAFVAKESLAKAEGQGLAGGPRAIPAFPLNGEVEYKGRIYYRHFLERGGYYLSVAQEGADFRIEFEETGEIPGRREPGRNIT